MTDAFHTRIRASLADANLQTALDANAARRLKVRKEAFTSLANPEELRQRAHSVREEVIGHLESYLEQFTSQVENNGICVHRATDSAEAIQLVLEIARRHGAKRIAKSKTMVSEEIGLNHALEAQGMEAIETDLGEYIVQLRGEPPSHIITPAVHLRRQDVGQLFQEKLGVPYTEDIGVMTEVARRTLRQAFLEAEIGLSGVNLGVAETGTLCVVTNEGNGRMVTSVPPAHIALMGIERLVPNMDDLALMLSLLPRSATGQKLSVYTSLLHSPRRQGDPDGPGERHLILVDNGRRAILGSGLQEILYCIRCGACLNACPVFREIGGHAYVNRLGKGSPYSGPMGSVVSPALFGQLEYGQLARASSLCGACREACPVDIDLPRLLLRVRAGVQSTPTQARTEPNAPWMLSLGLKLYSLVASSPWRFALAQRLAGLAGWIAALFARDKAWMRLPAMSGWGYSKDFPRPAGRPFRSRFLDTGQPVLKEQGKTAGSLPGKSSEIDLENGSKPAWQSVKETFAAELTALGGHFSECRMEEVGQAVLSILKQHDARQLLVWAEETLPLGLYKQLENAGILLIQPTSDTLHEASKVPAGLTGAMAGIAESGSIVLVGGAGKPLTASLLPQVHIALLMERDLVENLQQALGREDVRQAPAAVIISGPSRTADIEMTLTIGVHGPGELYVVCIRED